jgi:hypothetical protein
MQYRNNLNLFKESHLFSDMGQTKSQFVNRNRKINCRDIAFRNATVKMNSAFNDKLKETLKKLNPSKLT